MHAQLGWVVNELLERSPAEAELGHRIAAMLAARSSAAREALHTLVQYKQLAHGSLEGDALQLSEVLQSVDPVTALQDRDYHGRCEQQRTKIMREKVKDITDHIDAAMKEHVAEVVPVTGKGCDDILATANPRSGVDGVIALAAVRLVLRHLCGLLAPLRAEVASPIAQGACRWLMARADAGRVPAFLVIESAESIRDDRSRDAAIAMASFLTSNPGPLDPGIAVCISEGIEDGLYETDRHGTIAVKRERLNDARFTPDAERRWSVPNMNPELDDIRAFWRDAATALQDNAVERDDLPHWMNVRLDLRRDTAA